MNKKMTVVPVKVGRLSLVQLSHMLTLQQYSIILHYKQWSADPACVRVQIDLLVTQIPYNRDLRNMNRYPIV